MKRNILLILIGLVIGISATVYALDATEVDYKDTKVDQALDDLYDKVDEYNLIEEVLWTNSNPTATFAVQVVTLSKDITTFDYIKIIYNTNPTNAENHEYSVIYPTNIIKAYTVQSLPIGGRPTDSAGGVYMRAFGFSDTTSKIQFGQAAVGAGSTVNNNLLVPKQIIGIK